MPNIALLDAVVQAIALQTSVAAGPSTDPTEYVQFLSNPLPPTLPRNESVTDEAMVGDGTSRFVRNVYNYYWSQKNLTISGLLNDHIACMLFEGFLAGTRTITALTPSTVKERTAIQRPTPVPQLFSIYRHLEGEKFIHADMFPNAFTISQEGEGQPNFSFDLLGTGKFIYDTDLSSFDEGDIVAAPNYEYFHGAATEFSMTDGTTNYTFTADKRLINVSVEGNNNGRVARRPGDSFLTSSDRNSGAYSNNIAMGKVQGHIVRVKIDLGAALPEFKAMVQRKTLTAGKVTFNGFNKVLGSAHDYEFEINFPKARFSLIDGDTDDQFGAIALEISPEKEPVSNGLFTSRVKTDKTSTLLLT